MVGMSRKEHVGSPARSSLHRLPPRIWVIRPVWGQIVEGFKCHAKEFTRGMKCSNRCFRKMNLKRMCGMNWKIWRHGDN